MAPILWQNRRPPLFVTLAFRNGMEYRYVSVCVNSANDASTSCKNFVNLGPGDSEMIGLIGELIG